MYHHLVKLLSLCWIADGHTIHPTIEGKLTPTGIESTRFQVAGMQVHAATPNLVPVLVKSW